MTAGSARRGPHDEGGFVYLTLLVLAAAFGVAALAAGELWSHAAAREKERELLFVGGEFRRAIGAYYRHSPVGAARFPRRLEDLLADPRVPTLQRYLRRVYRDPITGKPAWGLVRGPQGGIMGVYSLSDGKPIKTGGFIGDAPGFQNAASYADWKFVYAPPPAAAAPPAASPAASPASPPGLPPPR